MKRNATKIKKAGSTSLTGWFDEGEERKQKSCNRWLVCGWQPTELQGQQEAVILVDYVLDYWFKETLSQAVDPKLNDDLDVEEMDLVLKVGLLCSHSMPMVRSSMSQVLKSLTRNEPLPANFNTVLEIRDDYSSRIGEALQVLTFRKYSTQWRRCRSQNRSCPPAGDVHEHLCKMYLIYLFILSPPVLLMAKKNCYESVGEEHQRVKVKKNFKVESTR